MKKFITVITLSIISVLATAEHKYQNSDRVVYRLEGESVYHTDISSVQAHASLSHSENSKTGKIYMQLEKGCKKNHMHMCPVCKMLDAFK